MKRSTKRVFVLLRPLHTRCTEYEPVSNIFTGIDADVAVRNTNSTMHRVSYHITIIGKIAFLLTR